MTIGVAVTTQTLDQKESTKALGSESDHFLDGIPGRGSSLFEALVLSTVRQA